MIATVRDFLLDLLANLLAAVLSPHDLIGLAIFAAWATISAIFWHQRQKSVGKPGMASLWFILLCFGIALIAVAGGTYGIALNLNNPQSKVEAKPQTQPYRLTNNLLPPDAQTIIRVRDGANIPSDSRNANFQRYSAWLSAGNNPDPVEAILPRKYAPRSPSDADKEIQIIDDLRKMVMTQADIVSSEAGVINRWTFAFDADQGKKYFSELSTLQTKLQTAQIQVFDKAEQVPVYYENDLSITLDPLRTPKILEKLRNFESILRRANTVIDPHKFQQSAGDFTPVIGPQLTDMGTSMGAYSDNIQEALLRLDQRRHQLSEIAGR
jgi:hypothetical protein